MKDRKQSVVAFSHTTTHNTHNSQLVFFLETLGCTSRVIYVQYILILCVCVRVWGRAFDVNSLTTLYEATSCSEYQLTHLCYGTKGVQLFSTEVNDTRVCCGY